MQERDYQIDDILENLSTLEVAQRNVASLPEEQFALARRQGFGASDASVYLGLQNKWKTAQDLVAEKLRTGYTEEEKAIGEKDVVRKGKDLEPLNLKKTEEKLQRPVYKPQHMYRIKEHPYLLVNFDGVVRTPTGENILVPVEAKFVSMYGDKYYDFTKGPADWVNWADDYPTEKKAAILGVPAYYYAQVQQQILALNAPYGWLTVIRDKGWEHHMFKIPRDEPVINQIIYEGFRLWETVTAKRTAGL